MHAALTCTGVAQLLPFLGVLEIWVPRLNGAFHGPHTALSEGTRHSNQRSHRVMCAAHDALPLPSAGQCHVPGSRSDSR